MVFPTQVKAWFWIAAAIWISAQLAQAAPVRVQIEKTRSGWQLLRGGRPYVIKGVGLPNDFPVDQIARIREFGGNSIRTWDANERTSALLAAADCAGLTVCLGIWLEHERHHFNYNSVDDAAAQFARVRRIVLQYKEEPALLCWDLGNEMEEFTPRSAGGPGENAAIWSHLEALAEMVKRLDPNHPVLTSLAEIGGRKVDSLNRLCPDLDAVGINAYSRAESVVTRYCSLGGNRPILITEFGPRGHWEAPLTSWGAVIEPTSTVKAEAYRATYIALTGPGANDVCLGSYAFIWGHKQEATDTWFGLLLSTGERLAAVDELQRSWTGSYPKHRAPKISVLRWRGGDRLGPGDTLACELAASSPSGEPVKVEWVLRAEVDQIKTGGDHEDPAPVVEGAVLSGSAEGASLRAPATPGAYRLFCYVRDSSGAAASGNLPFLVRAHE
jgi:hypothetical protein